MGSLRSPNKAKTNIGVTVGEKYSNELFKYTKSYLAMAFCTVKQNHWPSTLYVHIRSGASRTTKMLLDSKVRAEITIMLKIKKISKSFLSHIGNIR